MLSVVYAVSLMLSVAYKPFMQSVVAPIEVLYLKVRKILDFKNFSDDIVLDLV